MIPQLILMTIATLAASISKLIAAGADKTAQEEALMESAEASKRALDFVRFGSEPTLPPDTQPGA